MPDCGIRLCFRPQRENPCLFAPRPFFQKRRRCCSSRSTRWYTGPPFRICRNLRHRKTPHRRPYPDGCCGRRICPPRSYGAQRSRPHGRPLEIPPRAYPATARRARPRFPAQRCGSRLLPRRRIRTGNRSSAYSRRRPSAGRTASSRKSAYRPRPNSGRRTRECRQSRNRCPKYRPRSKDCSRCPARTA